MKMTWHTFALGLMMAGGLMTSGWANGPAAAAAKSRGGFGFIAMLDRSVGLNDEQRDSVRGLLAQQRDQTKAIREQTDSRIRALLTPDQQKKFDAFLANQQSQRRSRMSRAS